MTFKALGQEGPVRYRIESICNNLLQTLPYLGVAEDCCIATLTLVGPTCTNISWYGVITKSYFIFTLVHSYSMYSIVKEDHLWPINCKRVSLSSIMML